jgi:hypothetical protein
MLGSTKVKVIRDVQKHIAGWIDREEAFPSGHEAPVVHPHRHCSIELEA